MLAYHMAHTYCVNAAACSAAHCLGNGRMTDYFWKTRMSRIHVAYKQKKSGVRAKLP
eukprot:COSAG02_NODE_1608_length_11711_cov_5.975026_2_plen_57_part_00